MVQFEELQDVVGDSILEPISIDYLLTLNTMAFVETSLAILCSTKGKQVILILQKLKKKK